MNFSFIQQSKNNRTFRDLVIIILIAIILFAVAHIFQLFYILVDLTTRWGEIYLDEVFVVLIMLGIAFGIFSLRRWHELRIEVKQRKRAEEEVHKLNQELEQHNLELNSANKELETFNYSVSHDLRQPLQLMSLLCTKMIRNRSAVFNDDDKQTVNKIQNNIDKMNELINALLSFSRVGQHELKLTKIDMVELANNVITELQPMLAAKSVQFNIKSLPPIQGDRTLLHQVLTNLIANAIKFTGTKSISIVELGGWVEKNHHGYYVKDNGVGFDMQNADKLFAVFQRLHKPQEFKGTGVGLAIVQRVIERHGGRIWAKGKINEGAIFYFTLPKSSDYTESHS